MLETELEAITTLVYMKTLASYLDQMARLGHFWDVDVMILLHASADCEAV